MSITILKDEFAALCRPLADRPEILHTQFDEGKKRCTFSMLLRASKIELVYCWKGETLAPPSVLYCRVYLNKNVPIYLHLPELISAIGVQDFRACYFPCIENTQRMRDCFAALLAIVDDYIPQIEAMTPNGHAKRIMENRFREDFWGNRMDDDEKNHWNYNNSDDRAIMETIDRMTESIMVERFSNLDAYYEFLTGNWKKSLQKYEKLAKKKLSRYEQDLCEFMSKPENRGYQAMPPQCLSIPSYRKFKDSGRDLVGMMICSIPWSLVFCTIIAVINAIMAQDTVFFFGISVLYGFIPALGCGVFSYIVLQKQYLKFMRRYRELEYYEMCDHRPGINKLGQVILVIVLIGCLGISIALPLMGDRYYEDHARIYQEGWSYRTFDYGEIQQIYYVSGRYNDYGDLISRPSYILLLQDDTVVDLDCTTASLKRQVELVEELFPNVAVIEVETDQNIQK